MNPLVFMIVFMAAVLVIGTVIFFYWRSQYGVWAQERQERQKAKADDREQADVIKYD